MNVLLLTVDSLRADRVSAGRGLTPAIDGLGRDGATFRQAVTHGHGTPVAFPAILSGTYPMLYGGCSELSPERPVLARFLRDAGYETAAFTSNPHLFERYGYDIGFDAFNEYSDTGDGTGGGSTPLVERVRERLKHHIRDGSLAWNLLRRVYYLAMTVTEQRPYAPADAVNGHVLDWLDERDGDRPFFVWAHYMDTHYPFYQDDDRLREAGADPIPMRRQRRLNRLMNESPEQLSPEDVADLNALYDAETRFVDEHVGALLEALERRGLREETLVALTSDHGEALGEHDAFGHYQALYEELVRVPLVVAGPGVPATTVERQTGLVDVAPTVLDYAGIEHSAPFSGESVRPWLEAPPDDRRLVVGHGRPLGVRTRDWKYIWWERDGDQPVEAELFDLDADPGETTDVSGDHPDVVEDFDAFLADHVAEANETDVETDTAAVDDDIADQLEALGYK